MESRDSTLPVPEEQNLVRCREVICLSLADDLDLKEEEGKRC